MAEFTPRTFDQILDLMIAHVQANTDVSDFSEGSVVRSILEAASLEDDEQYFQISQLLTMYSIFKAKGEKLDRRLADFGIARILAKTAVGKVRFSDTTLTYNKIALATNAGSSGIALFSSASFPTSGYPYTIRAAEGTSRMFDIMVVSNNTSTGVLSLGSPIPYDLLVGDRISLVTGAVSRVINSGQVVQCPATQTSAAKLYATTEQAFIEAGNLYSNEVYARCTVSGSAGNVPSGRVIQFVGSSPFAGAAVLNTTALGGGRESEDDEEYVKRAVEQITGLSRGTVLALKSASKGVEDRSTGQRVVSSNIVEDFVHNEVIVYIDDGTGFTPEYVSFPETTLASNISIGSQTAQLTDGSKFPSAGAVLLLDGASSEVRTYTSKPSSNSLYFTSVSSVAHTTGVPVLFVDVLSSSTEYQQKRFKIKSYPIVRNTDILWKKEPTATWTQLVREADYVINKGTGDVQLITALPQGSQLVANVDYFINLVSTVQKVLEGDPSDEVNYPGVKAAGVRLSVEAPAIRRIEIVLSITAKPGYIEADLYDDVRSRVESYVSSLGLGEDVIVSRIVDAVHDNTGVASVRVVDPPQNVVILESELPTVFDSLGNSLVQVL